MYKSVEKSARTIDEAIQQALDELNISMDEALVEVLRQPEPGGLLGLGRKDAIVRVSVEESEDEAEAEAEASPEQYSAYASESEAETESDQPFNRERKEGRSYERSRKRRSYERNEAYERKADYSEAAEAVEDEEPELTAEEQALRAEAEEQAVDFVTMILRSLEIHGKLASYYNKEGHLCIDVDGDNIGNAIGRRGDTLRAIQYLTGLVLNREREEYIRVQVDIGHYRERRREALRREACRLASRVRRSGRKYRMDSMSSAERRLVHLTLADFPGVETYSEGYDPDRRVVIVPARRF